MSRFSSEALVRQQETHPGSHALVLFFFAETFWSLKHFGHLSHSCIKTRHNTVFSLYFQTFWPKLRNFFGHFKNVSVYDRKKHSSGLIRILAQVEPGLDLESNRFLIQVEEELSQASSSNSNQSSQTASVSGIKAFMLMYKC